MIPAQGQIIFTQHSITTGSKGGKTRTASPPKKPPKEKSPEKQKLEELVQAAPQVLFELSTVFPFDFFPDRIVIDTIKVNLISSELFYSGRTQSILIPNIADVVVDTGLFFAKLQIVDKFYPENNISIQYLKKDEALLAHSIIQGLIVAHNKKIDLTQIPTEELANQVITLGQPSPGELGT